MKLLYAHDHIFYKYKDDFYSNGSFPKETLLRYTKVFEDVRFVSRQRSVIERPKRMSLSTTDRVNFISVPNFKSFKTYNQKSRAEKIIEEEVKITDCVIARTSSVGSLAIKYAKKYNKPYLIEVVGCAKDSSWNHGSLAGKILSPYSYLTTKKMIREAPYVIYVTSEFLQNRYPTEGINTNCSNVDISTTTDEVLVNKFNRIQNNEGKVIFGTIGAIDIKYKGHDTMIKALSMIKDKINIDIEYRIVGGGEQKYLKDLSKKYGVADIVKFEGRLSSGRQIYDFLDTIDIYVQPSRTEGLPRSVIEAMSRGCPVIGSDAGGIPELLNQDCIFNKSNYNQLSELILTNGLNKGWLKEKAKRNFEEAKKYENYIIEARRNEFLKAFKRTIENQNL